MHPPPPPDTRGSRAATGYELAVLAELDRQFDDAAGAHLRPAPPDPPLLRLRHDVRLVLVLDAPVAVSIVLPDAWWAVPGELPAAPVVPRMVVVVRDRQDG